ncbi:MAG: exodeoxyribonuclease VII large subunit, partial [bacterium]
LAQSMRDRIEALARRLAYAAGHPLLQDPRRLWEQRAQRVDELAARLPEAARRQVERLGLKLGAASGRLDAISPLKVLGRGYAIATRGGKALTKASQAKTGDEIHVRLHEGELTCEVTS